MGNNIEGLKQTEGLTAEDTLIVHRGLPYRREEALLQNILSPVLALWIPSDQTGSTDMTSEFEAFVEQYPGMDVVIAPGSTILLQNFGTTFSTLPARISVIARGVTIKYNNDQRAVDVDNTGNASDEYDCTTVVDELTLHSNKAQTTRIVLSTSPGAVAHDYIAVYSDDAYPGKSGSIMGEIAQLIKDEQASNTLYTHGTLSLTDNFTDANTKVRILDKTHTFKWVGGTFESNGDADDETITVRQEAIRIIGYVGAEVSEVRFDAPWAQTVWLQCVARAVIQDFSMYDILNNGTYNGFGYGPYIYGMGFGCIINNVHVHNARHPGFTTDGDSNTPTDWYQKGYPTKNQITNVRGYNCNGSLIDTHHEGADNKFMDCSLINGNQDERLSFVGRLAQSRAVRDSFVNCHAWYCAQGISIDNVDHGFQNVVVIENCSLNNIKDGGTGAYAVSIDNHTVANKVRVELNSVTINECDRGINIGEYCELSYKDLKVNRSDAVGFVRSGAVVYGEGLVADYRGTSYTGTSRVWLNYSDGADSYCTCIGSTIFKGGNSFPQDFFNEADTAGNVKYVYHDGFTDVRKVGTETAYSATLSKEAGATTFTNLTDVGVVSL